MLVLIKNLYKDNGLVIAVINTVVLTYLSLSNINEIASKIEISNVDKYYHVIAYFGLTLSWLFAIQIMNKKKSFKKWIIILVFLFGILMELLQQVLTIYRQADILDVVANSSGIVLAFVFFEKFISKKFKMFLADS